MPASPQDAYDAMKKLRMLHTAAQAALTDLTHILNDLHIPEPERYCCPECQLNLNSPQKREEHVYVVHDGPEPAHWVDVEKLAQ